ncbi:hypothetical protein [Lacrimispora sp. 38-1]|uniref:hypothetical protein n=1 Tax=Lacrimispora sp. 38-1 TaxID=3125778 RepID=UPI003CF48ED6
MTQADRYMKLAALTKRTDTIDSSYHAAFYLLSHDPELWETASRYVTVDGISFTGLKRATRDFDERTRQVVDIAHSLFSWNSKCNATPFDISRLGYPYMELVCNAFYIAAGEVQVVLSQRQDGKAKMTLDDSHYQNTKRICSQLEQLSRTMAADITLDEATDSER